MHAIKCLYFFVTASCGDGLTYSREGGTSCACNAGALVCNESELAGCYCPDDNFVDEEGVCKPNSECERKLMLPEWPRRQNNMYHVYLFGFPATCENGKEFKTQYCMCTPDGEAVCEELRSPDCVCPMGSYETEAGECVDIAQCHRMYHFNFHENSDVLYPNIIITANRV